MALDQRGDPAVTDDQPVPAGWYPDPSGSAEQRYWDGTDWTDGVARGGVVTEEPLPAEGADDAWDEWRDAHVDQRVEWPGPTVAMAVAGWVLAMVLGAIGAVIATAAGFGPLGTLILAQGALWIGMLGTCWFVSHRYGSGDIGQDYRLAFWRKDAGWGLLLSIVARVAVVVVMVGFALLGDDFVEAPRQLPELDRNAANIAALVLVTVVGAPLIEELFFRGLVQRALETVLPVALAIGLQAVLFGAIHAMPGAGVANLPLVVAITASGAVFGFAAWRWRRLGPGIAAHAFFNLVPTVVLVL